MSQVWYQTVSYIWLTFLRTAWKRDKCRSPRNCSRKSMLYHVTYQYEHPPSKVRNAFTGGYISNICEHIYLFFLITGQVRDTWECILLPRWIVSAIECRWETGAYRQPRNATREKWLLVCFFSSPLDPQCEAHDRRAARFREGSVMFRRSISSRYFILPQEKRSTTLLSLARIN